jgi:CBS domain-containing protein
MLPVTQDPFTPRLIGVVTDRDLCLHAVAGGRDPAYIWVSECLTPDPVCCGPGEDVQHALELMKKHRIRRLPVVDARHEVVGVISLTDLVRKAGMDNWEIVTALQAICEPEHATDEQKETFITAA